MDSVTAALHAAILAAIARTGKERELPAAVLAAIGETHVVIDRDRWERVLAVATPSPIWINADAESREFCMAEDAMIRAASAFEPVDLDPIDLDPIDPAAEG